MRCKRYFWSEINKKNPLELHFSRNIDAINRLLFFGVDKNSMNDDDNSVLKIDSRLTIEHFDRLVNGNLFILL